MQFRRVVWSLALLAALGGCKQGENDASAPAGDAADAESASADGSIDTEDEARAFATTYINEQIVGKQFSDDEGNPVSSPVVEADTWKSVEKEGDRWTLKRGPPGNWYFHVSFDADGSNVEYDATYFAE